MTMLRVGAGCLLACAAAQAAEQPGLRDAEVAALREAAVGEVVELRAFPLPAARSTSARVRRIDVYAPDARVYEVRGSERREIARSDWRAFISESGVAGAPQLGFALAPDGRQIQGVLFGEDGIDYALVGTSGTSGLALRLDAQRTGPDGEPLVDMCANDLGGATMRKPTRAQVDAALARQPGGKAVAGGPFRQARVAIETDNEFMTQRFADNTTNANNYLVALFAGLNVMYQRDFDVLLVQGDVFLRTGGAGDPYSATEGGSIFDQLDEFGEVWLATQGALNRAFAVMLSGKLVNTMGFSGLAWLLPGDIYCNEEGFNFASGICPDGTCTAGHYSANRTFTFQTGLVSSEPRLIGHEIGHNFGAEHTHCSNAVTGAGPTNTNTIDTCSDDDVGQGCYGGALSCPALATVNGVPNVRGTVMSYCSIEPGGCSSSAVFADGHRTLLTPFVQANLVAGCFTLTGGGEVPFFANGFENP